MNKPDNYNTFNSQNDSQINHSSSIIHSQIELLSFLKESKYSESISSLTYSNTSEKANTISNNWNIFLIKIMQENQLSQAISPDLSQSILSYFSSIKESLVQSLPITQLNQMFFSFRLGHFLKAIQQYKQYSIQSTNDYILYVNATMIMIEICLMLNLNSVSNDFIRRLEKYLEENSSNNSFSLTSSMSTSCNTSFGSIPDIGNVFNNDKAIGDYYNNNETFHKETGMSNEIILLYKCYMNLNQNYCDKAKKNLDDFKAIYSTSQLKQCLPLYNTLKRMYNIFKVKLDYLNNSQFKCYKHLNSLTMNYNDQETMLFAYNSTGILHFKLKKVKSAEFYFGQAYSIMKENKRFIMRYWHIIIFNLALCDFYMSKYDKAYERLMLLKNNEVVTNNSFYYYRLGVCCVEREFNNGPRRESLVHKYIRTASPYDNLVSKPMTEEELNICIMTNESKKSIETKCILLSNVNPSQNIINKVNYNIREAIGYLKQCILLLKGYNYYSSFFNSNKDKEKKDNGSLRKTNSNHSNMSNNSGKINNSINDFNSKNSNGKIYHSAMVNLLFCLLLIENYAEVIYYSKEYEKSTVNNPKKDSFLIDNYIIEAYIRMGNIPEALERIVNKNNEHSNSREKGTFYNKLNHTLIPDINYQIALRINLLKINFLQNNLTKVEEDIRDIIQMLGDIKNIPSYISNILLYYSLITRKQREAIDFIQFRHIPNCFLPKNASKDSFSS